MVNWLHMPPMLTVLGVFFLLYGALQIILLIKNGYWLGIFKSSITLIKQHQTRLFMCIITVLLVITLLDKLVSQLCTAYYNVYAYTILDFICSCAEGWFVYGTLFLLWCICDIFVLKYASILLRISLMSSIYASLINGIFKFIFNRQRPSIGLNEWNFFRFFETGAHNPSTLLYAFNSMPSGHVITTIAAITPLIMGIKDNKYRIILAIWGILVAISRVYTMNHWLSDVIVSSILGIIIGISCYKNNSFRLNKCIITKFKQV